MSGKLNNIHPVSFFFIFISVIVITVFSSNPIFIFLSLLGAVLLFSLTFELKTVANELIFYILMFAFLTMINPLFSHNGKTVLFFMNSNPITLEALIYGGVLSAMIISVLIWARIFTVYFTVDKVLCLFSGKMPKTALLISIVFRYLGILKQKSKQIMSVTKVLGYYSNGKISNAKSSLLSFDSLLNWTVESSVDTAFSMKSRGFGTVKRSSYSDFKYRKQDIYLIVLYFVFCIFILYAFFNGTNNFKFYPTVSEMKLSFNDILSYLCFGIAAFLPSLIVIREKIFWKYYQSKI